MEKKTDLPIGKTIKDRSDKLYESCLKDLDDLIEFATSMKHGLHEMRRRTPHWDYEDWLRASLKIRKMLKPTMDTFDNLLDDYNS